MKSVRQFVITLFFFGISLLTQAQERPSRNLEFSPHRVDIPERKAPEKERPPRPEKPFLEKPDRKPSSQSPPPPSTGIPIPNAPQGIFVRGRPTVFGEESMEHLRQIKRIFMSSTAMAFFWTNSSLSELRVDNGIELSIAMTQISWDDVSNFLIDVENHKRARVKEEITQALYDLEDRITERNRNRQDVSVERMEYDFFRNFDKTIPDPAR